MLHDTKAAIEALILGFLLSPYGIPMIGAAIIAFIPGMENWYDTRNRIGRRLYNEMQKK